MTSPASHETDTTSLTVSEARFACLLDTVQDGIVVFDLEGRVLAFNREAERMFGCPAQSAIGHGIDSFLTITNDVMMAGAIGPHFDRLLHAFGGQPIELLARHRDGTIFSVEIFASEIGTDAGRQFVGVLRDLRPRQINDLRMTRLRDQVMHLTRLTSSTHVSLPLQELRQPVQSLAAQIVAAQRLLADFSADDDVLVGKLSQILDQAAAENDRISRRLERQGSGQTDPDLHPPMLLGQTSPGQGLTDSQIFIVDDDKLLCHALASSCAQEGIGLRAFDHVDDFLLAMDNEQPGAIILNYQVGEWTGLDVLRVLDPVRNAIPVFMTIDQPDVQLAAQVIKQGVVDIFEKPFNPDLIAIRVASTIRAAAARDLEMEEAGSIPGLDLLTPRERDVLREITSGASNKEAGRRLGISSRTIEVHRARIMEKLGARNAADLVRIVLTSMVVL